MTGRYRSLQELQQQEPLRLQSHAGHTQYAQDQRFVAPRELYRATQYHHPMYDAVEDDVHRQSAGFDTFVDQTYQRPHIDPRYHAGQGRARLSLAPASFRLYEEENMEKERTQPHMQYVYQEAFEERDQQPHPAEPIRVSLGKWDTSSVPLVLTFIGHFAYNPNKYRESSLDTPLGASSSPALNASRRRAEHHETVVSRPSYALQPFEDLPSKTIIKREEEMQYLDQSDVYLSKPLRRDIDRPFQPVVGGSIDQTLPPESHAPPTVQGISLVPVTALPDRLRTLFPFPTFNAVQSKCFDQVFKSNDNFVLSSPTGSGKTVILELAICRAIATNSTGQYKVVYQAPTKALCSERQRDWEKKFAQTGLKCAELTGDSNATDLRNVQSANIIITTPEKWDSMTRKWKDHDKLLNLIKLFLIDEVHILNENRGAVLEAVVSRMKSISSDVRFVALSATVPNFQDVAAWLGKSSAEPDALAPNERFGEEFRPVKLRKHVCGYISNGNEFAFDKQLDARLPDIFIKYSERKPVMIFCATRKSCATTAAFIANWWATRSERDRLWNPPAKAPHVKDKQLLDLVTSGVAFHHGGLDQNDRLSIEKGFLVGDISIICCTSTLAVGVNLPCHLVIIKNTVSWSQGGLQEYSDLDMMQMLGRAGRPQFDDSAVAVIMTRQTKVCRYETLATGEEILESKLHLNLIEHMNAEIGLGTIRNIDSARKWLAGTFLYVRLQQNPIYYKLDGSRSGQSIQEQVDDICSRDIALLKEHELATGDDSLRCTDFGHAMARYYVQFETMKLFMGLQPKSTLSEILSTITQAAEFSHIRFRQGEKSLYKTLNRSPSIRFPIPVNLDLPAQKVSLIIQSVLGHADLFWDGDLSKHKQQYAQEAAAIFKSINSLIRCIIDCQICLGDSVSIHSALILERGLGSKAWDDSPMQMVQIPGVGAATVRKLVNAGIRSIEDLGFADARRIETISGRNPPFGLQVLNCLKSYPKLRISLRIQPSSVVRVAEGVKIQVKADIGFLNETPPDKFANKPIYVCVLAETSDGRKIHFARINGTKLGVGQSLVFPALLTSADQRVNCYLMCESIAGSMRDATVIPRIALTLFPPRVVAAVESAPSRQSNISRRRIENTSIQRKKSTASDEFGDADIDDETLAEAVGGGLGFDHIDNFAGPNRANVTNIAATKERDPSKYPIIKEEDCDDYEPAQLPNGRWLCNHRCKDKEACKHYCCKHGMDRPPKKAVPKPGPLKDLQEQPSNKGPSNITTQTTLQLKSSKRKTPTEIEQLDLTKQEKRRKKEYAVEGPHDYRDLHKLHKSIQKKELPSSLHSVMHTTPAYHYGEGGEHQLSFLVQNVPARSKTSSDYGDLQFDELGNENITGTTRQGSSVERALLNSAGTMAVNSRDSETYGDDESVFGEAIVGLADLENLRGPNVTDAWSMQDCDAQDAHQVSEAYDDVDFPGTFDSATSKDSISDLRNETPKTSSHEDRQRPTRQIQGPFQEATSSPERFRHSKPAIPKPKGKYECESQLSDMESQQQVSVLRNRDEDGDIFDDLLNLLDKKEQTGKGDIIFEHSVADSNPTVSIIALKKEEPHDIPGTSQDLQPWLFHEFGGLVELVDE